MCRPASMVVTKSAVFWGHDDSHEAVLRDNNIHMDGARGPNGVRVEIVPPDDGDMCSPPSKWVYQLDEDQLEKQDKLPSWYDAAQVEARVRKELPKWIKARVVKRGQKRAVNAGECVFSYGTVTDNYGTVTSNGGTVTYNDGTVTHNGGTVTYNDGTVTHNHGTVTDNDGAVIDNYGTVTHNHGTVTHNHNYGTVTDNRGTVTHNHGTVITYSRDGTCTTTATGVLIDRTGDVPVCHVGPQE